MFKTNTDNLCGDVPPAKQAFFFRIAFTKGCLNSSPFFSVSLRSYVRYHDTERGEPILSHGATSTIYSFATRHRALLRSTHRLCQTFDTSTS